MSRSRRSYRHNLEASSKFMGWLCDDCRQLTAAYEVRAWPSWIDELYARLCGECVSEYVADLRQHQIAYRAEAL